VTASVATLTAAAFPDQPGCSAAVGRDGTVVWAGARGLADRAAGTPLTPATVFDIGSVTKQFTATAALLLAADGKLGLDDPLSRHVSGLPAWQGRITVSQLIHHTSGIPDYPDLLRRQGTASTDRVTSERARRAITAVTRPDFPAGARFAYSNSNYLLLGEVVGAASGAPLPRFLAARVFEPLGLTMTLDPTGPVPGKAMSYVSGSDAPAVWPWETAGDGGIQTTPTELVRWGDNYRTGKVGGAALLDAQVADPVRTDLGRGVRYAAGILVDGDGGLSHEGGFAGYRTAFTVNADRRVAVAVACNTAERYPGPLAEQLEHIWA
jgi:CubicO group peptidase (beta-lactamase class C family)